MQLDRQTLQQEIHALYRAEHAAMGERGTLERLEQARQWDLSPALRAGGVEEPVVAAALRELTATYRILGGR